MNPALALSAEQILALTDREPERLFGSDPAGLPDTFRALARRWHPDRNGGSKQVFSHILALRAEAERKLADGSWAAPRRLCFTTVEGRTFALETKRRRRFELGEMAIAARRVAFLVSKEHTRLFDNGLQRIAAIPYPDKAVRRDLERFMPSVEASYETADRHIALIRKTDDLVLLADLLDHAGGRLPPRHVAWIVSSLLNLVCFFEVAGFAHNALSTDTVFVSPQGHAVYPLGGWWYAAPIGSRIAMLPDATYALLSPAMANARRGDIRLDLESVRAIGRAALGDPSGVALTGRPDLPRPMADFLRLPSASAAIDDYRTWEQVLTDSFGPRRFVELPISSSDVYA